MPAPGKYPDELRRRAIRLTPDALACPGPARGCLRRVGDELGAGPEALRGRDPAGGLGRSPGTGPAPPPRGPGAPGSRRWRSAGRGRGGAIGRSASACPWRRSVSARRADPPSASTSAREGLRGLCRVCAVLTESGCRTGSVHLTCAARSRPPSKRSISDAALDERILALRAEPFNATLGSRKTWRLPGSRQEGPRVARMRRGCGACGRRV